jgi:6-phosphogluconolactonase (cycloisomerase 2 family)
MGCPRAAWTTALAIAFALLAAGTASAFQFKGCVSQDGAGPCASIGGNTRALDQPAAVVVSPDGRHVYVAAAHGSAVGVYARDPNSGGLTPVSCISRDGSGPCTSVNHDRALRGARAVVMSPDGRFLYVAAGFTDTDADPDAGDTVSVFSRDAETGALTLTGCVTTNSFPLCTVTNSGVLDNPAALAMAPDGDELYLVGDGGDTLGYFRRDASTGQLGEFDCLGVGAGCDGVPHADALRDPASVAVTRDGRFVYAAARTGDAIARFTFNNANGTLSYLGCVGASTAGGCSSIANASALNAPVSLVVSPDGGNLFAAAQDGSAIAAFAINPVDGSLGFVGCDGSGECTSIGNGNAANAPAALAMSPSGGRLYTASAGGNAIGIFARSVSADPLGFLGCISADGAGPCASAANGAALNSPSALAVSPDGRHLYGTARNGHAVALLGVAPPACAPVTVPTPFQTGVRVHLPCGDPDGGDPVNFAVGGPANGTLSELSGNSVLFTPNPGFFGQGIFDFSATDIDGAATARATINVGAPPPRPRRMNQTIKTRFAFNRTHTWILRMQVLKVPGDAKVQVRCKAPKRLGKKACPFKRKTLKPKRHRATVDVKKNAFRKKKRKLRAGVRIQLRITAPGAIGKVVTYKLRPNKLPRTITRCLPPGATKPQKRC